MGPLSFELWDVVFGLVPWQRRAALRGVCRAWRVMLDRAGAWCDVPWRTQVLVVRPCILSGQLDAVQWMVAQFGLPAYYMRGFDHWALSAACREGHLALAQWLVGRFYTDADVQAGNEALRAACTGGHLEVVRWLASRFRGLSVASNTLSAIAANNSIQLALWLDGALPMPAPPHRLLASACSGGGLAMVRWVARRFGLGLDAARAEHELAIRVACHSGHLFVAQWVAEGLVGRACVAGDIRDSWPLRTAYVRCLTDACVAGRLAVLQWLFELVTPARLESHELCELVSAAAFYGHLEILQWLAARSEAEVLGDSTEVTWLDGPGAYFMCASLCRACANGHLTTAQWLADSYPIAQTDPTVVPQALANACTNGRLEVVWWLVNRFALGTDAVRGRLILWDTYRLKYVRLAQWLVDRFQLSIEEICQRDLHRVLSIACRSGQLETPHWLHSRDSWWSWTGSFRAACASIGID